MVSSKNPRRQMRGFIVIWTVITFIMGAATFFAIYYTYSSPTSPNASGLSQDVAIPVATTSVAVVVIPTSTSLPIPPTVPPTTAPTQEPTTVVQAQILDTQPPPTETLPPPTPTPLPVDEKYFQVGIQVQEAPDLSVQNQDGWYNSVANDLGLRWVKQQVRWKVMEPEKGNIDWSILDLVMPSAQRFGLNMMLSIVTAPDWAREPGANLDQNGPPANPQDYADFVSAILNRYPGQVHAIEVWNEQNIDREWTSVNGVRAEDYVNLLRTTYATVKAIDPGIIVISGALSPTGFFGGCTNQGCDDQPYLEALINAGMLDYADCVGAHHNGYNIGPSVTWDNVPPDPTAIFRGPFDNPHPSWSFRSTLQGYATRIAKAGSDKKLCVTEFGWASSEDIGGFPAGFEFAADNTLQEQADYLVEALNNMEQWDIVWLAFIWNFNYGPQAGYAPDNDNVPYSLIGPGFTFRPAYDAVKAWQADYLKRTGH